MGRKPNTEETKDVKAMVLVAQQAETRELSVAETDRAYLEDGETYNIHICLEKARMFQRQTSEGMLGFGAQLNLLKVHEERGTFLSAVEQLGISERAARYFMAASRKFGNRQTFADLGGTKMQVLSVLDDDSIQTLEDGGEADGVGTLDDIEKMSVRELKAALRKEKADRKKERDAQEEVIAAKNNKLDELERELRYQQPPTKAQLAQIEIDEQAKKFFLQISSASETIIQATKVVDEIQKLDGVEFEQLMAFGERFNDYVAGLADAYEDFVQAYDYIHVEKSENEQK